MNMTVREATAEGEAARARRRDLVRRGYDVMSDAYRAELEAPGRYAGWAAELAGLLRPGARVLDLGCGAGIPATRQLTRRGLQVIGADFSAVQLRRARRLAPAARLVQADLAALQFSPGSLDAVASFYALIHLPQADQRALLPRIRSWLRPAGLFLAMVSARPWAGCYLDRLDEAGLTPLWDRFVPDTDGGHSLILARAAVT